jgi:hypothetical protein
MLESHSTTILAFPARRKPAFGSRERVADPAPDNVTPLRDNVIVLADRVARRTRRPAPVALPPTPGGEAA